MPVLGRIEGLGTLVLKGSEAGLVRYDITVFQEPSGLKSASGVMVGDVDLLEKCHTRRPFEIRLQTGGSVRALIRHYGFGSDAKIEISGPVPGF